MGRRHGRTKVVLAGAGVALALVAAACGDDDNGSSASATTTTAASSSTSTGAPSTVSLADAPGVGPHLVGPDSRTLYLFEKDQGTTTACTGGCVPNWPALTATAPTAGAGLDASKLSTANGEQPNQVVYNGHLLYYFAGDSAPGQVNGTKVPSWYPVNAAGDKIDND